MSRVIHEEKAATMRRCCPDGHWSVATRECIELPGGNGPRCDNVSKFDVDAALSRVALGSNKPAYWPRDGGQHVPCTLALFTARGDDRRRLLTTSAIRGRERSGERRDPTALVRGSRLS